MTSVLDHGYLKIVESWGSDERIVESARMSTNKGFLGWGPKGLKCPRTGCDWEGSEEGRISNPQFGGRLVCPNCGETDAITIPGDEKLLRYLYENQHATPFEFGGIVIEVKAPIMVFREWHRHRTQSYNEMSARYTPLPDENYMPTADRCLVVNGANKQANAAGGADVLTHESVLQWLEELDNAYRVAEACYQSGLRRGIPKELARLPVPVARYTRMRASTNLRNWLAFMTLRMAPNAQWEIRQYANAVAEIVAEKFPRTYSLFAEGRK